MVHVPLELGPRERARCRAVILPENHNMGDRQPKVRGKESGAINGFLLGATIDRRDLGDPGLPQEQTHAYQPLRRQGPLRHRDGWSDDHLWMCDEINRFHSLAKSRRPC